MLTPIIEEHQKRRKTISDEMVFEFMEPRPLNFQRPLNIKSDANLNLLPQDSLKLLNQHLADKSYIHENTFSEADTLLFSHLYVTEKVKEVKPITDGVQELANVSRWESHIKNLLSSSEHQQEPKKLSKEEMKRVKKLYGKCSSYMDSGKLVLLYLGWSNLFCQKKIPGPS